MAPPKSKQRKPQRESSSSGGGVGALQQIRQKYLNFEFIKFLIFDPASLPIISVLIIIAELVLNVLVVRRVPYTEIDWIAYMQECEGFLNGTTNYAQLRGDTGPLVYPAAFVYIYSALYFITSRGQNIQLAQYIFIIIYILQMWLVLRLYTKSRKVPPYVLVISAFTSYRIHSIYVLRLFNDPVAILFLYAAINLFLDQRWTLGSLCFSLGVGVKMNILLFAPALLLFYISNLGYWRTLLQLAICGTVQLLLGAPFLLNHPFEYLKGSFDLGRIFEHKWTVNYRFLDRSIFENKLFHLILLAMHLLLLCAFVKPTLMYFRNYVRLRELQAQLQPQIQHKNQEIKNNASIKKLQKKSTATNQPTKEDESETLTNDQQQFLNSFEKSLQKSTGLKAPPQPTEKDEVEDNGSVSTEVSIHFEQCTQLALLPFFLCNFIGVLCARSLHYQFYVWYFHSLPYLTWSTNFSLGLRFLILGLIEFSWNTYPSTNFSSAMLHVCHLILLIGVGRNMLKTMGQSAAVKNLQERNEQQKTTSKGMDATKTTKTKAN